MTLANAAVEVFHVFAPQHRYDIGPGGFVEGSIYHPTILGTNGIDDKADWDALCLQARDKVLEDVTNNVQSAYPAEAAAILDTLPETLSLDRKSVV